MKGVIRIEQPDKNTYGWQGRLYFDVDGARPPSKFFSDIVHGGKKKAEAKCSEWVIRQHQKYRQQYLDGAPIITNARTETGEVGVYWTPGGKLLVRATYRGRSVSQTLPDDADMEYAARARRRLYTRLVTEAQSKRGPKSVKAPAKAAKKSSVKKAAKKVAKTATKKATKKAAKKVLKKAARKIVKQAPKKPAKKVATTPVKKGAKKRSAKR